MAGIPEKELHRYAAFQRMAADAAASPNEKAMAKRQMEKLEAAYPDIGVRVKAAEKADPDGFTSALWSVIRTSLRKGWEEEQAKHGAAPAKPAGRPEVRHKREPEEEDEAEVEMTGSFRANNKKHLCVLTITIRGVDSTTEFDDPGRFADAVAEEALATVQAWFDTEDADEADDEADEYDEAAP
jgi:hypothetical protein